MTKALAVVRTDEKPKAKRERVVLIETQPKENWFVRATTNRGREVWYLRFQVTGQNPQLFGPFKSKHQCLLFLDDALDAIADLSEEMRAACEKRMLKERCQKTWPPIIEYPILAQIRAATKKGRPPMEPIITYDICTDTEDGWEFVAGSYDSKAEAVRALAEQRRRQRGAYLTKSVMTRCRAAGRSAPARKGDH